MTFIKTISKGHYYEGEAITNFEKVLIGKIKKCGFFFHPTDTRYGISPGALGPLGWKIFWSSGITWKVPTLFCTMSVTNIINQKPQNFLLLLKKL